MQLRLQLQKVLKNLAAVKFYENVLKNKVLNFLRALLKEPHNIFNVFLIMTKTVFLELLLKY